MKTKIQKTFDFDAAHRLDRLPENHKCHRLHGHTYRVEIEVEGEPDDHSGMVVDYAVISAAWSTLHAALDHRYLNEIPGLEVPTTEVLAAWILAELRKHWRGVRGSTITRLRVYESSTTWAEVTG